MARRDGERLLEDDPRWYQDAIIYQLHVRAFLDSDGNGIGDFRGLTEKLDYLQDLGVTALWLLPFYPSPLRDDGYDTADYRDVHPSYGTLQDFKRFLREAHGRGLRVITELVLNHTSDQHRWFLRSKRARPGTRWRDYYVWSDTPERYQDARIIFKDFESSNWAWDQEAGAYYWHRFYSHQPDLNFDNPRVHDEVFRVLDFWLKQGVDGLRLDAVPYLYEREGTNCENLPETHALLRSLRRHVDDRHANRMLLAEANQWPEDAVAYLGGGDECHMAFHFPVMPRLFMAVRMEDRFPIVDIMEQTPALPDGCQWAIFLRNHDELTLEMVTDEERDYMYRVYAHDAAMRINLGIRRRLAPLLGNSRRKIELLNGLLFSLPGTPVLYYGDEIGMGDNIYLGDRDGVRTPMQWSSDRNAGFSRTNPQRLYLPVIIDAPYHYEAINVEAQQDNPSSMLWWMKRLIALRKRYRCFSRGTVEFLYPENRKVLAFVRRYEDECVLVVANLSRFLQPVELDLSAFVGTRPVELFGRTELPPVSGQSYFLTLGPHAFFWFALEAEREQVEVPPAERRPALSVTGRWDAVFRGPARGRLEEQLPAYLMARRWFGGKARRIRDVTIRETLPIRFGQETGYITFLRVSYVDADPEGYVLPIAYADGERCERVLEESPNAVVTRLRVDRQPEGVLFDALVEPAFGRGLLHLMTAGRRARLDGGRLIAATTRTFREQCAQLADEVEVSLVGGEQSNTSIVYGESFFLKLFRRLEPGVNPDLEIGRFLTDHGFEGTPAVAGELEFRTADQEPMTLGVLKSYVPNEGDAWQYTVDDLNRYFEQALATPSDSRPELVEPPLVTQTLLTLAEAELPLEADERIGPYLQNAWLLGQRTAEMHRALASEPEEPSFVPEPFSLLYQRSLYQSMRTTTARVFQLLEQRLDTLPENVSDDARKVLANRGTIEKRFRGLVGKKLSGMRIRCHGDYHLGQLLYTGKDFVIIDFEGEPARPVGERRLKRTALSDVAGMLRSFHYAAYTALARLAQMGAVRPSDTDRLTPWARFWTQWASVSFLKGYLQVGRDAQFLPRTREELLLLLDVCLLEKAIYELGYELNNRPDWVPVPVDGLLQQLRR